VTQFEETIIDACFRLIQKDNNTNPSAKADGKE
jgi:hypothetical protein